MMAQAIDKIFWIAFMVAVATLCLLGVPVAFETGGINTSLLELLSFPIFLAAIVGFRYSPMKPAFLLLVLVSLFPVAVGLAEGRSLVHVLREFAPISYTGFLFIGAFFRRRRYIGGEQLLRLVCWAAALYSALFVLENQVLNAEIVRQFWPHWRFVAAFALLTLLGRLAGLPGMPRFSIPIALAMLTATVLFAVQIRTRAMLLMVFVGALFVVLRSLKMQRATGKLAQALSIGPISSLAVYLAFTMVVDDAALRAGDSLRRWVALLSGSGLDLTAMWRLTSWQIAWEEAIKSPLVGVGFGSYVLLDPLLTGESSFLPSAMIHNTWLQLFYNGGLFYLAAYLYFFYCIYKFIGRGSKIGPAEASVALVVRGLLLGYLVYITVGTGFFGVTSALPVWFLLGFYCHQPQQRRHIRTTRAPIRAGSASRFG